MDSLRWFLLVGGSALLLYIYYLERRDAARQNDAQSLLDEEVDDSERGPLPEFEFEPEFESDDTESSEAAPLSAQDEVEQGDQGDQGDQSGQAAVTATQEIAVDEPESRDEEPAYAQTTDAHESEPVADVPEPRVDTNAFLHQEAALAFPEVLIDEEPPEVAADNAETYAAGQAQRLSATEHDALRAERATPRLDPISEAAGDDFDPDDLPPLIPRAGVSNASIESFSPMGEESSPKLNNGVLGKRLLNGLGRGRKPRRSKSGTQAMPERVLTFYLVAPEGEVFDGIKLSEVFKQRCYNFAHHGYFSCLVDGQPIFSIANVIHPGLFPSAWMTDFDTPGIALIGALPSPLPDTRVLDLMVGEAKELQHALNARFLDENRSTVTRQTMQHLRDELQQRLRLAQLPEKPPL